MENKVLLSATKFDNLFLKTLLRYARNVFIISFFFLIVSIHLALKTVYIDSFTLSQIPLLSTGDTFQITCTMNYSMPQGLPTGLEDGLLMTYRWRIHPRFSIKDTEIATISQTGKITGISSGVTMLCVEIGKLKQEVEVVVGGVPVEDLEFKVLSSCIHVGTTVAPGVSLIPSSANYYADVELSSSDDSILHDNNDGSFTAISSGIITLNAIVYSQRTIEKALTILVIE